MSWYHRYLIPFDSPFRDNNPYNVLLLEDEPEYVSEKTEEKGTSSAGGPSNDTEALAVKSISPAICDAIDHEVRPPASVGSHQYFFSIIPQSLGKSDGAERLRKKKYSQLRKRVGKGNPNYLRLKEIKRNVKNSLSHHLRELLKAGIIERIQEGLEQQRPFCALHTSVFREQLSQEQKSVAEAYEKMRQSITLERTGDTATLGNKAVGAIGKIKSLPGLDNFVESEVKLIEERLQLLLKEHKKHTFERFISLPKLYAAFKSNLAIVADRMEERKIGWGNKIRNVVLELLFNSAIDSSNEKLIRARAGIMGVRITNKTVNKKYRDHDVMGYENEGEDTVTEREEVVEMFNYCLSGGRNDARLVENFQRSHTLPSPRVFCWTPHAVRSAMRSHLFEVPEDFIPEILISSELIQEIQHCGKTPGEMDEIFGRELDKLCEENEDSDEENAFKAIMLLKELYLRLFSETEFFPDFINTEMDRLSEWQGKEVKGSYQTFLATTLSLSIHNRMGSDALLAPYFTTTTTQAVKAAEKIIKKESTLFEKFKLLCIIQVLQSLQFANGKKMKSVDRLSKKVGKAFSSR